MEKPTDNYEFSWRLLKKNIAPNSIFDFVEELQNDLDSGSIPNLSITFGNDVDSFDLVGEISEVKSKFNNLKEEEKKFTKVIIKGGLPLYKDSSFIFLILIPLRQINCVIFNGNQEIAKRLYSLASNHFPRGYWPKIPRDRTIIP